MGGCGIIYTIKEYTQMNFKLTFTNKRNRIHSSLKYFCLQFY